MLEADDSRRPRRELADALRELRKAAGLSGERLAARCAMSQSKISRIERGAILPTVTDVERILNSLDVPREVVAELVSLARIANVDYTSWRTLAQVGLWRKQAELTALAESSTVVRQFLPAIPSGLIQTEEYARAVLTPGKPDDISWDVERALNARLGSQQVLRDESRRFVFLMTEHAVRWRQVGSAEMARQCSHMADVSSRHNVEIAIIPQEVVIGEAPLHVFVVYDERIVVVELFSGEVALRDPRDINYHLNLFQFFLDHALAGEAATNFLRQVADEFMRELD